MSRILVKKILEKDVMKLTTDWLSAKRIFYVRTNTYQGRVQSGAYMRQGRKGMADILTLRPKPDCNSHLVVWLEVKRPKGGVQSDDQWSFQNEVQVEGHKYRIVYGLEDLEAAFNEV